MIAKRYEFRGQQLTLREIVNLTGINMNTLQQRVKSGKRLDAPVRKYSLRDQRAA